MSANASASTAATSSWPSPGRWVFEAGNSEIAFSVKHMMISRVRGSFRAFSGEILIDANPARSSARATIEAASIDTGMARRDSDLRGADFLDVAQHNRLAFVSTALRDHDGPNFTLDGELTIAGVTRPVSLAVEYAGAAVDPWGNSKAVFSARTRIDREEFGLTYNAALEGGGVLIGPTVDVEIEIQAKPDSGKEW